MGCEAWVFFGGGGAGFVGVLGGGVDGLVVGFFFTLAQKCFTALEIFNHKV